MLSRRELFKGAMFALVAPAIVSLGLPAFPQLSTVVVSSSSGGLWPVSALSSNELALVFSKMSWRYAMGDLAVNDGSLYALLKHDCKEIEATSGMGAFMRGVR